MEIGILGHVGNLNHGDEGIIFALIHNLKLRRPDVRIVGFTIDAEDMEHRHGITAYPNRRSGIRVTSVSGTSGQSASEGQEIRGPRWSGIKKLVRSVPLVSATLARLWRAARLPGHVLREIPFLVQGYRRVKTVDLFIVVGSEQIMDGWGGPWKFPYTVMKWCLLARLGGAVVAYASVGSTPLSTSLSRWFHATALRTASFRSYRDEGSRKLASLLIPVDSDPVLPDLAFSFDLAESPAGPTTDMLRVAVNPMALYMDSPWSPTTQEVYERYVTHLTDFIVWLRDRGYAVELFLTQERVDPLAVSAIQSALRQRGADANLPVLVPTTSQDVFDAAARGDYLVATRFHGILFCLMSLRPVLGIAYGPKAKELMESLGQGDYVVDVYTLTFERLRDTFLALEANPEERVRLLQEGLPALREVLDRQYDLLIQMAEGREPSRATVEALLKWRPPLAPVRS